MSTEPGDEAPAGEPDWQRRRRIAEVFGDVLPDTTGDERSSETPNAGAAEAPGDRWLRDQVPPHHGG